MLNLFTISALVLFPLIAIWLFANRPFNIAVLWTILLSQLILPVGAFIKFDMIPQFDKNSIPCICLVVACAASGRLKFHHPRLSPIGLLTILFLLGPIVTSYFNDETLRFGPLHIPGVGLYDAISALISSSIILVPYFVGRGFLTDEADNAEILRLLVVSMLVYSIPLLLEVRLSPQFHNWIYGYYPSAFVQAIRDGGFRPMVFMGHGLLLAHFVLLGFIAAIARLRLRNLVARTAHRQDNRAGLITIYIGVVLFFCRTLGASLYGILAAPLVLFATARSQMRLAVLMVILALLYPTMRYLNLLPTDNLVQMANSWSPDRGQSLGFRFGNEDILLSHAIEKPYFGWGRYGRNRVFDKQTGRDLTITDGEWIITLGQFGIIGFIAEFGLLCMPVFRAAMALRFAGSEREALRLSVLALMLAISVFDLLPNAFLVPWTWLMAGALLGRSEALLARKMEGAAKSKRANGLGTTTPSMDHVGSPARQLRG